MFGLFEDNDPLLKLEGKILRLAMRDKRPLLNEAALSAHFEESQAKIREVLYSLLAKGFIARAWAIESGNGPYAEHRAKEDYFYKLSEGGEMFCRTLLDG